MDAEQLTSDAEFERVMDATQTVITLKAGEITDEQADDIRFLMDHYEKQDERGIEAFHRGYQCGLERGGGADTAKLIEERDRARSRESVAHACSSMWEHNAFILAARVCREMVARFVEQGGDATTAASIRANWNPAWGDDPGAPTEEQYEAAKPIAISCKARGEPSPHPTNRSPSGQGGM